jgi:hypothetical protein
MDPAITSFFTIVGAGVAAYYGSYFKKRGEDQAMKEGFAEVLRQTEKTTEATKKIEARISDDVWDRQKRWELKRDVLLEAIKRIVAIDDVLTTYKSFIELDNERMPQGGELDTHWAQRKLEKTREWNEVSTNFDETCAIVDVLCSLELNFTRNKPTKSV